MSQSEFLAVLPILLYGFALQDIFEHWRSIFNTRPFLPYIILVLILFEESIYSIYTFWNLVGKLPEFDYWSYFLLCIPPAIFLLAVKVMTPDRGVDPETYLKNSGRASFALLAIYTFSTYFISTGFNHNVSYLDLLITASLLTIAYTKWFNLIYVIAVVQIMLIVSNLMSWELLLV